MVFVAAVVFAGLARLASLFSNQELCARLREARDSHLILNEILRRENVARSA